MKKTILKISLVFVFLLCLVLNIVLLCTPVFGSYRGTPYDSSIVKKIEISFYDNTYDYKAFSDEDDFAINHGFFYVTSYKENSETINLFDSFKQRYAVHLTRHNVFHCTVVSNNTVRAEVYSSKAIILQVIYPVVGIASIVLFVVIQLKDKKKA